MVTLNFTVSDIKNLKNLPGVTFINFNNPFFKKYLELDSLDGDKVFTENLFLIKTNTSSNP